MIKTKRILDLVGNTPLIHYRENIFAKLESCNPSGSIKDRMTCYMLETAEENGEVQPGDRIIEATSGNTGISFSWLSAVKGYRFTAVMAETMSEERRKIMRAYGADFILVPTMEDTVNKLQDFEDKEDVWLPRQFDNPANVDSHRETTGKEILDQLDNIGAFIAGVGTGGTLMGVAEALKTEYPDVKIVAVEPAESPVLSGGDPGSHQIQGIGSGFIPKIVDLNKIDEVVTIKSDDAVATARRLAKDRGLFVGISSGANILASAKIAEEMPDKNVATVLPDNADRYLSTGLF
ncbi:MAG: cysteine synthase A [Thermoproteota archaeon]